MLLTPRIGDATWVRQSADTRRLTVRETKHVAMNAKQQEQLDKILRGICKDRKVAVEADLDSRLSYREKDPDKQKQASWDAYSRFLLSDGHTVYVNLRTMDASVSKKVSKRAQGNVERRLAKQKRRAERLAAKEAKAATKKAEDKPKPESAKVKAKPVKKGVPVVKFDKDLPTLEGTSARQVKK